MIAPPPMKRKIPAGEKKPRGWHFKVYFEQNGIVYSRGEVVTDKAVIAELKKSASTKPVKATKKTVAKKSVAKKVTKTVKKTVKKPATRTKKNARTTK